MNNANLALGHGFLTTPARVAGLVTLLLVGYWSAAPLLAQPAATGSVTGTVTNGVTGRRLPGAVVEVMGLGRSALTDADGRFVISDLPGGGQALTISYLGLDPVQETALITPGGLQTLRIELTSSIYRLNSFKVTGEREGVAASITAQRNADNVKNVVTIDEFGILPNMVGGELIMRGVGWQFRPDLNVFSEISNLLNTSQKRYMSYSSRISNWALNGTLENTGITGRF